MRGPNRWGGARANAGRPASGPIPSEPHKTRPPLSPRHPVHVVARLARDASDASDRQRGAVATSARAATTSARAATTSARAATTSARATKSRRAAYAAVHRALRVSLARGDFSIIAVVIRKRRLELVVEAASASALARGMQGFQVAAARHWNRACGRSGTVFPDRYRPRTLRTRAAVRAALATVGARGRVAWPTTHLLRIELAPIAPLARLADPDP